MATKLKVSDRKEIEAALDAYNAARENLSQLLTDLVSEWDSEMADKSDKWREGEAGTAAQERIDAAQAALDELPEELFLDLEQLAAA